MRHHRSERGNCDLRAGTYYETVTPDSGITITSYDGEPVTVDGTDAVTGWTLYQGSIYKASAVLSTGDTNQVFAGNQMMTEARWPNGNDLFNVNWATAQARDHHFAADRSKFAQHQLDRSQRFTSGAATMRGAT